MYSPDCRHSDLIAKLGFKPPTDVRGRLSIADLFPKSRSRTGIYLLQFANGNFYIGQAVDACRRFAQHRIAVGDITGYSFQPASRKSLDAVERDLIHTAERSGLPLTNRVHVSNIIGETDLDLLVEPAQQELWLNQWPRPALEPGRQVVLPQESPARIRTDQAFQRLRGLPEWTLVRDCLRTYCNDCVPYPASTQLSFWSLSCLPTTNKNTWPRFAAVNAGLMEVFVIGWNRNGKGTWGFVNVARSTLAYRFGSITAFRRSNRSIEIDEDREYRAAGQDQLRLSVDSITKLTTLVQDPDIRDAASKLMLNVMRTRPTLYGKFHCPALADEVLLRFD